MAITITYDSTQGGKSFNHALARGKKIVAGKINLSSTYATDGLEATLPGFSTVDLVILDQASGYSFAYDYTNSKIVIREPGSATATTTIAAGINGGTQLATDVVVSGWASLRFVAYGN